MNFKFNIHPSVLSMIFMSLTEPSLQELEVSMSSLSKQAGSGLNQTTNLSMKCANLSLQAVIVFDILTVLL